MTNTTGLVQKLTLLNNSATCVWIGANPSNTQAFIVTNDGSARGIAYATSMIQALAAAATNYRQVVVSHGSSDSTVTGVRIDPL